MRLLLVSVFTLLFLSSCFSPSALQSELNKGKFKPGPVHAEGIPQKLNKGISIKVANSSTVEPFTKVVKKKGYFFCPIIFYMANYDCEVTLGKESTSPNFLKFIDQSIGAILIDSSHARITTQDSADYKLFLELKQVDFKSKFHFKSFGIAYFKSWSSNASSANGQMIWEVRIIDREGNLLFNKTYNYQGALENMTKKGSSLSKVKKGMMQNLVDNFSVATKELSEKLRDDLIRNSNLF